MNESVKFKNSLFSNSRRRWAIAVSVFGVLIVAGTSLYGLKLTRSQPSTPLASPSPKISLDSVTALGRIEPQGEVIKIAPPPNQGGAKVEQLLIEEGDRVEYGQKIAILDNYDRQKAAVELAAQEVEVAQANLDIVKAGAKTGEIEAQKAEIKRLEAELTGEINTSQSTVNRLQAELEGENQEQQATIQRLKAELADAERDFNRYKTLAQEGVISDADLDQRSLKLQTARERLEEGKGKLNKTTDTLQKQIREEKTQLQKQIDTLQKQIAQAKANLARIAEIRPVDVQKAQAEVNKARASLKQSQADLDLAYVKAPLSGQILKIYARPGEQVKSDEGIAEIGNTEQMMVVAEVYESDINKVQLGQKAIITSENGTFKETLTGKVHQIGLKIGKKDVLDTDPAADVDVRVIEVKILLNPESSRRISGLTYAKVIVKMPPKQG